VRRVLGVALACLASAACSSSGKASPPSNAASITTTTQRVTASGDLTQAEIAKAIGAVRTNWDRCLASVNVSSASASVEAIDDSSTGRPVDRGNRPVLVHVKWEAKSAAFLVDLKGRLTGAALYGATATAMVDAAKRAGGDC
jgi:hypothetical protein